MDHLFNAGMKFMNRGGSGGGGGGGSGGGMNPIALFQQLDQNGDGKIGEDGTLYILLTWLSYFKYFIWQGLNLEMLKIDSKFLYFFGSIFEKRKSQIKSLKVRPH
jgi:hypothetical protein